MKIGIISDTHDNLTKIEECVNLLNKQQVDFVVHCGDFVSPFSLKPLDSLNCDWIGVFGNNDGEKEGLQKVGKGRIFEGPHYFDINGVYFVAVHDIEEHPNIKANVVLSGHTHMLSIEEKKTVLHINPGEVCGWLTTMSSFVILDLDKMTAKPINF